MLYIYFLERKAHCSPSNRFSKHKTFLNIFWSCYSAYLDLENTIATPYPYHILKNCPMVLIYYSFSLIQLFSHKKLAPCLSIEVRSTTCDEEWSYENIGSTLNIGTQNFDLIWFLSYLNLLVYCTSWWFCGFEWFSIVLHHYLGLGFWFLVLFSLSLSVFHSVSWSFLYFFYLINLIRFDKLIWFL